MRLEGSSILLHSRRLFQQFLVDSYTMIESEHLRYLRNNQPKLRVNKYNSLHESLVRGEANAILSGQRIILPSSFTGGPRYMFNNCKDAFAICKYFGYPSYFITITCNPKWDEIKRLLHGTVLKAEDRLDIASRIFSIKLDELISDFKNERFFGNIFAYVCTVEFQKRGLPHAHILLFMQPQYKPKSPDDIDRVISAEIPDKTNMPRLYAAVEKFMVHGPCGRHNISSPCMINGRCSKFFPKPFSNRTIIDEGGFPKYKRLDNGHTITKKNAVLDNSYIVPYNPDLLLKYGCHINVEHTCQTSSIKYLFKYVRKGNDRVTASFYQTSGDGSLQQVVDEIRNYYNCRYISACEAAWWIFGYEIQLKEPAVIRLPFHLPDEQPVVFKDHENIADVIQRVDGKVTKLAAWMLANREYPFARSLTYSEFPTKFVWNDDSCMWFPRKQGFSIGRLTHVPRGNGEDYYMRILLNIQRGCMSFTDLRTVDGVQCYQQLSEYLLYSHRISTLNPDIQLSDDQLLNMTLSKVEMMLQANGRSLREFNGKTFLYRALSAAIRAKGEIVLNVASSGIASLLLPKGRTAHSRIGDGLEGDSIDGESEVNIPEEILIKDNADGFDNIIRFVYPGILTNLQQSTFFKERTILAPTLDVVHEINNHIMKHIEADEKVYLSSDSMYVEEGSMESELDTFTPNVLNAINCSGLRPHELILKVGVPVMLLRNIDQFNGLCNGTRLQIPKKAIFIGHLICNGH
ncbi:uncharacterized protein LOC107615242 [Arachis ipaensis]|uniref:uncharacterized protein LOC107615242 n=1 Tax=Arachis ipaensis TaxID=130454 RepID=UPI0007AFC398|nr:uncharacterized protein LOC107615242 [Arachis ipaensis]